MTAKRAGTSALVRIKMSRKAANRVKGMHRARARKTSTPNSIRLSGTHSGIRPARRASADQTEPAGDPKVKP